MTPKLFMFYVGGDVANCNIEVHDVRFSIGQSPEDCFDDLRQQWWGESKSLHVDSWAEISHADGYDVTVSEGTFGGRERLYFVNLGGYEPNSFEESHRNVLIVANTKTAAMKRALQEQISDWRLPHKDNLMELEKALSLTEYANQQGYRLHLVKAPDAKPLIFRAKYTRLG